jgi:hypothetical protein
MRPKQHRVVLSKNNGIAHAGMVSIPINLRVPQLQQYPSDNTIAFERWYMENFVDANARERLYLPIQWTALYCNNNYGKCAKTKLHIQSFLDGLDRDKKYYTIVQYDDGILNDLSKLDIKVMAMSGPRIDYPLPLLAMPHQYQFNEDRDILASFIGRVTHPIRSAMIGQLQGKDGYYISTKPHSMRDYCQILARSKYALCPRGYGQTSFRIQEAIQYGAVPIYISDDFILPYDKECGVVFFDVNLMPCAVDEFLDVTSVNYGERLDSLIKSRHLFTYQGCKAEILEELRNENP